MVNRNVIGQGGRTSIKFEPEFWDALEEIAIAEGVGVNELVRRIEVDKEAGTRTSAVRVFVLGWFREKAKVK